MSGEPESLFNENFKGIFFLTLPETENNVFLQQCLSSIILSLLLSLHLHQEPWPLNHATLHKADILKG